MCMLNNVVENMMYFFKDSLINRHLREYNFCYNFVKVF